MNTQRLDTHATLITDVAKSMPSVPTEPAHDPTKVDVTLHEDTK